MLETIITKLVESVVFENSQNWLQITSEKFKHIYKNKLLEYYHERTSYYSRFKTIIRKDSPLLFKDIYLHQRIQRLDDSKIFKIESPNQFFQSNKYSLIIGEAGSGKSTLSKYMFLESIKELKSIPILIELRDLNPFDGKIDEYISNIIFESRIATSSRILQEQLKKGSFIFYLDGYDETSTNRSFAKNLSEFINRNSENIFFITSRPGANVEFINRTFTYNILPINFNEIPTFISKQALDVNLEKAIIDSIKLNNKRYITDFLGNPLLLLIYIITFRNNPQIPHQRSIFYRRVIDTLFIEHDSTKLGFRRLFESSLNQEQILKLLENFSITSFFENKFEYRKEYIFEKFDSFANFSKLRFDINNVIIDLIKSTSIWQEDTGVYSFIHRSLQEYLTAVYIKKLDNETKVDFFKTMKSLIISNKVNVKEIKNLLNLYYEIDGYCYYKYFVVSIIAEIEEHIKVNNNAPVSIISLLYDSASLTVRYEEIITIAGYANIGYDLHVFQNDIFKIMEILMEDRLLEFDREFKVKLQDYLEYNKGEVDSISLKDKELQKSILPKIEPQCMSILKYILNKNKIIKDYISHVESSNRELLKILKRN